MPNDKEARLSWARTQLFKILPFVLPDFKDLSKEKQIKLTKALAEKPDIFAQVLAINVKDWDKFPVEKKRKIMSTIYSPEQIEELEKWPWFDPVFALSAPVGFGIKDIARQAIKAGAKAALKETGRTAGAVGSSLLAEAGTTAVAEPLEEKHPVLASILAPLVGVGVGVAAERGTKALLKAAKEPKVAKRPAKPKLEEEVEKIEEVLKPEIKEPEVVEKPEILEEKPKKVLKVEKGLAPDLEEITKGVKETEEVEPILKPEKVETKAEEIPPLTEVKLYAGLPLDEVLKKGFKTLNQFAKVTREKAAKKELYRLADILGYGKEIRGKDIKGIKTWTAKLYNLEDIVRRYGDYYPEVKEIEYAMKWIREPQANRWAYAVDETIMKPLNKLSKESKEKVFRILYRESLTGKPDPNVKNLSSEEKNVYRRVRRFLEIVWKDIKDSYKEALKKYIDAKPMSNEEKEILTKALEKADPKVVPDELKTKHAAFYRHLVRYAEMHPVSYYMPQKRTGGFMVKLIDPETNEVIFAHDVGTSAEAKRIAEAFEKGDYSVVEKWFKELGVPFDVKSIPKNVKVVAEEISRIPVEAGAEIPFSKIIAFLHTSAERAKKLPKEDVANFYMNLAEDIDNFLKSLGWSAHLIRRKNIPGFSLKLEDAEKRLRGYLYGYGLSKAKKQAMEHAYKAFYKLVHRKGYKPEGLIRELSDYLSYAFGTPEPREVRQLNRLIVLWFLGGRVKSALINATQNLTSGLAAYVHNKVPTKQLFVGLKKVFGKRGLDLEDRKALRKAIQEGWLDANIVDEMMNQWRGMNTIVDTAMLPFRYVETFVNRAVHFMGAFDYFRKIKKMPFDEAYKKALEVMLEGHFWASRYNRAPIERKSWGRLLTALQTFTFHYFRYAFNLARKKDWKALGWLLGSPMVLGGVVALPGGELVKEHVVKPLYRKFTGRELEIDLSKHPELKYGPAGYISPSISISVGVGFSEDPMRVYGGVIQNLLRQIKRSISLWKRGDKEGAIMELMPLAIRDVYRGIKGKAGLRTTFGEVVLDEEGRPVSLTGKEAFMMALGFKPMRVQKVFDMRALEREIQRRRNEILRKLGTALSKAETAEEKKAALRALIEYNEKVKEKAVEAGKKGDMIYYRYWNLMHITPEEVVRWAELNKRAEKGIRKEIQAFARQIM